MRFPGSHDVETAVLLISLKVIFKPDYKMREQQ